MAVVSIEQVLDDTRRFFVREMALLLPLGFATYGIATLIAGLMIPVPKSPTEAPAMGPWVVALLPIMLLALSGYIAVNRMVLRSRISVAEALADAVRLLPKAIGLLLTAFLLFIMINVVASLFAGLLGMAIGLDPKATVMLALAIVLPPTLVLSVRLAFMLPLLADRELSIRDTFVQAIALTRGHALRIAGLLVAQLIFYILFAAVIEAALGSLLIIVARSIGVAALAPILMNVILAAFNAVYACFWAVLFACYYARLVGTKGI